MLCMRLEWPKPIGPRRTVAPARHLAGFQDDRLVKRLVPEPLIFAEKIRSSRASRGNCMVTPICGFPLDPRNSKSERVRELLALSYHLTTSTAHGASSTRRSVVLPMIRLYRAEWPM